jgi:hypothetical protein
MATSGSADLSVAGTDIIKGAIRALGLLASGQTPTAQEYADGLECLNFLIKQWQGPSNFMTPGLKLWKRKHLTLTLSSTNSYTIKTRRLAFTSGGTTAIAVGNTITGATGGATAVVMSVEVTSGTWAGGDAAGELIIMTQVGTFESENLNVGASSNLATIAADSKMYSPFTEIEGAVRRTSDGIDHPMDPMTLEQWMALTDKDVSGTPNRYYYERKIDEIKFWLNRTPSDTTDTVFMVVLFPFEDFDAHTDTVDTTPEYYRALKFNLALDIAPEYSVEPSANLSRLATQSLAIVQSFAPEQASEENFFEPERDD